MASTTKSRSRQLITLALFNFGVLICLYLSAEIGLHIFWRDANPFLDPGKNELRIYDPAYTHTLKANFDGYDSWGATPFRIVTNSLGFRDASARGIPLTPDRERIVFIGDSFTESLGVPYEQTFVGRFARAFPDLDVLNAAVSTYAPSVYYEKLKYYLDAGLKFDEAIVYIDISDMQDEAIFYRYDQNGVLQLGIFHSPPEDCVPIARSLLPRPNKAWWEKTFYVAGFLRELTYSRTAAAMVERASVQDLAQSGSVYSRDWGRPSWTYNKDAGCYGPLGIDGAIGKAEHQMDRLYELLSAHGVALSVGVYPWPQQLLYDSENSLQARIWREWCAHKCKRFFDHFPAFFRYKEGDPEFVRNLFFWGDTHYNSRGNQILANDLIEKYRR